MPAIATATDNVFFDNLHPVPSDSREELREGLLLPQKKINPKYFYDAKGSLLFEKICEQPEYYPTRAERSILGNNASEIARFCGNDCVLIEPGSGSSEKVRLLLDAMQPAAYVPLDISADFLFESALKLGRELPWLPVHAICADFSDNWQARTELPAGRRVIFYPGSTIGNMDPKEAKTFLSNMRQWIGDDGGMLIGVDLQKSEARLTAAYNDAQGVTADFNLNVLESVNSVIDTDFCRENFLHRAFYNEELHRIEMHLVSRVAQVVKIDASHTIEMHTDETIHTESSYKYSIESFSNLALNAGFTVEKTWLDDEKLFSVHYLTVARS